MVTGAAALTFWVVTIVKDIANFKITNTWIDENQRCFNGIITVQFGQDGSGNWEIILKSSHQLSLLTTNDAVYVQESTHDGFQYQLTNMPWNAQMISGKILEVPFVSCTPKLNTEPVITALFNRKNETCPKMTFPAHFESMVMNNTFENIWNTGFEGHFSISIPVTITDGWKIYIAFSRPLSRLDVPQYTAVSYSDGIYTVENHYSNKHINTDTSFRMNYAAERRSSSDSVPCVTAIFTWKRSEKQTTTTPQPSSNVDTQSSTKQWTSTTLACVAYNYSEVLHKSILFYEAQRSGKLPGNNRISWRGDSALEDQGNGGEDLTGGWYDAGDFVKFGFPMAFSTTLLSWGFIEFPGSYQASGEMQNMFNSIKWPLDYFIKAHVSNEEFYGQVGDGDIDHDYWGRPEDMIMSRPAFKIDRNKPGSDLAGETAAAMAAGSIVFRNVNQSYADVLLHHAKTLYEFADQYRGKYSESISDAAQFYSSSNYNDELVWGAAWLYKATEDVKYLQKAEQYFTQYGLGNPAWAFSWDEKTAGVQMLLYDLTGKNIYQNAIESSLDTWLPGGSVSYTPKGLAWRLKWGANRYAANTAFLSLLASQKGLKSSTYKDFGEKQIHYMLGDSGRSYVVGFGNNPPTRPHHSSSSCPDKPASCDWSDFANSGANPQVLYGALVGGPDQNDFYEDKRDDYIKNEVACDYNAGFQSAIAALLKSNHASSCSPTSSTTTSLPLSTSPAVTSVASFTSVAWETVPPYTTTKPSSSPHPSVTAVTSVSPVTKPPGMTTNGFNGTHSSVIPVTSLPSLTPLTTGASTKPVSLTPSDVSTVVTATMEIETTKNPTLSTAAVTTQTPIGPHPCGDVSVPSGFNYLELAVTILQEWPQGFTGEITITAPSGVRDGWEIIFLLKNPVSFLEVYDVTATPSSGTNFTLKNKDYNKELVEGTVTLVAFKGTKQNENDNIPCSRAVLLWAKEVPCPTIAPVSGYDSTDANLKIESEWNEGLSGKISVVVPVNIEQGWQFRVIVSTPITFTVYEATSTPSTGTTFTLRNRDYNKSLMVGSTLTISFTGTKQEIGSTVLCASALFLW